MNYRERERERQCVKRGRRRRVHESGVAIKIEGPPIKAALVVLYSSSDQKVVETVRRKVLRGSRKRFLAP
jgi:hypothetical protein